MREVEESRKARVGKWEVVGKCHWTRKGGAELPEAKGLGIDSCQDRRDSNFTAKGN